MAARMGRDVGRKERVRGIKKCCHSSCDVNAGLGNKRFYADTKANKNKQKSIQTI